jgi:predicted PurR-regulated permease PerM
MTFPPNDVRSSAPKRPTMAGDIVRTLGHWVAAQVKIVAILTGIYAVGFAISGVPWWLGVAIVCGLLNFIPVAGAVLALLIALPVAWLGTQDIVPVIGALVTYVVAQGLEGFYLTPKIMGRRLSLSPWLVFLAILAGGFLFGPLGVLFAVPVVAVLAIVWRRVSRRSAT